MKYKILENVDYTKVQTFNIKQNGIQIIEDEEKIEIYNDPFRTIPLFVTKDKNDELIIFSNFEDFYTFENTDKTIDEAGFWEIVLFGSGLWTRTLYKNVEQMPSASKIVIDKNTNDYSIERYWDFDVKEDKSIDSIEKAAKGLYDRLDSIFSKLDRNQKYVMGLSGGMDSRITLAFLSKYIPKENLELFTYGFDERLLEYKYACEVAEALVYNKPKFHKLTKESYKNAMEYLPQMSGGQIGINHCHIFDFLKDNVNSKNVQISNYISDAIFGLNTKKTKDNKAINYVNIIKQFDSVNNIDNIHKDIKKIEKAYNKDLNYTNVNEYIYWSERTPKVFNYFSFLHSSYISQNLVYADYDLFEYMLSVPIEYRAEKQLLSYILDNNFKLSKVKDISSRFQWGSSFSNIKEWYNFKFLNRANAVLRPLTKGYIQLFNKYQTEEQERLLYRDFHKDLKESTQKFVNLGLMNEEQKKEWDKLPLRNAGVSERYHLISLAEIIDV